jgi:hypothetical protein
LTISFDRLRLTQVVDRYKRPSEVVLMSLLIFLSTWLAFEMSRFYYDIGQVILWIVLTTAQYSLIRSVQPDAASSSVDERSTALSRPLYFCALAAIILALDAGGNARPWTSLSLYNVPLHAGGALLLMRNVLLVVLLALPILFLLGVFPMWRTALHHITEQVDMHMFGGSGTATAVMAGIRVVQAALCLALVYGFSLGLMDLGGREAPASSMWFAAFGGLVVALGDWLGRIPTDTPAILWSAILQACARQHSRRQARMHSRRTRRTARKLAAADTAGHPRDTHDTDAEAAPAVGGGSTGADVGAAARDVLSLQKDGRTAAGGGEAASAGNISRNAATLSDDTEAVEVTHVASARDVHGAELDPEDDPMVQKQRLSRLAWDSLTSLFTGVIWLAVCSTGVFHAAPNNLARAGTGLLAAAGVCCYLILPQLRAMHPFQCGLRPVLGALPAHGFAKVPDTPARHELATFYLEWCMRQLLLPVIVLASAAASLDDLRLKWGTGAGAFFLAVCSLKLARASRGALGLVCMTLPVALLFFAYDFKAWSETSIVDFAFALILASKCHELLLKVQFIVTYNAPWHIKDVWGSTAHAVMYPLAIPHTAVVFIQACIASILSAPVYPLMGTAVFLVSYFRPLRFWERNYSTKERDRNTRRLNALSTQPTANSLNAVFYHHVQVKKRKVCGCRRGERESVSFRIGQARTQTGTDTDAQGATTAPRISVYILL